MVSPVSCQTASLRGYELGPWLRTPGSSMAAVSGLYPTRRAQAHLKVGPETPLQYSYLENSLDRGAWRATVHQVAKSQTRLSS